MDRILTDKQILAASRVKTCNDKGEILLDTGYLTGRKQVAIKQDAKTAKIVREETLREVGEWLMKQPHINTGRELHFNILWEYIAKLKQGELK